jgi:ATP-dependent RNA helicase DOB1
VQLITQAQADAEADAGELAIQGERIASPLTEMPSTRSFDAADVAAVRAIFAAGDASPRRGVRRRGSTRDDDDDATTITDDDDEPTDDDDDPAPDIVDTDTSMSLEYVNFIEPHPEDEDPAEAMQSRRARAMAAAGLDPVYNAMRRLRPPTAPRAAIRFANALPPSPRGGPGAGAGAGAGRARPHGSANEWDAQLNALFGVGGAEETRQLELDAVFELTTRRGGGGRGGGRGGGGRGGGGRGGGRGAGAGGDDAGGEDISKVMTMIKKKDMYPVICFSFSRRECEEHPKALKNVDFTNDEEKAHIRTIFNHALTQCMAEEDRDLDAVTKILPLLEKGVGIHHSGLLPIVKELVEILFGESLVKCLFATETFAMGLNMPAKTVVFTSTEKFDGTEMRLLAPGEYTQMSGRAGRRGKDDRGTCIIMVDKKLEKEQLRGVCLGTPQPLNSEFKLTYYSILNLLKRAEGVVNAEYVIERSFHQFQHAEAVPRHKARLVEIEEEMTAMTHEHEAGVKAYHDLRREISACEAEMRARIVSPENAMRFLKPGRMIRVKHDGLDFGWGVVVHVAADAAGNDHVVDTLLQCAPGASEGKLAPASRGGPPSRAIDPDATCEVLPVSLAECVHELSAIRVTLPDDLRLRKNRESVGLALNELHQRYADDAFPRIDPIADMGIDDDAFAATAARCEALEKKLAKTATFKALQKEKKGDEGGEETKRVALYEKRAKLEEEAATLRSKVRSLSAVGEFRKELKSRAKVLKRLGHVDDALVVKLKGRAACEIDTADELLVTELMFNGCFTRLDASQLVALCSMFVPVEKVKHYTTPEALTPAIEELTTAAREIATLQKECKLDIDVDEFVDSFKPVLCEVVFDWSKGARFDDVMKKTDLFEGTVIRALRRLDELMMELHRAACAVGDEALAKKFEEGAKSLRHGVVFATSLYL